MSTYTDTGLLDRSIELIVSDSDDSTRCVDDLEHLQDRDEDSVTLNAEADLSDDNSYSLKNNAVADVLKCDRNVQESADTSRAREYNTISLNLSELGDSGRFTEEASSSHVEIPFITYDDAKLSHSHDTVKVEDVSPVMSMYEVSLEEKEKSRLYEYIDSNNSDSSDNTAVCDRDNAVVTLQTTYPDDFNSEDQNIGDNNDLQYDSFVDIGKF